MSDEVEKARSLNLSMNDLIDVVLSDSQFQTNEMFDYLWRKNMSETEIYRIVSKCFFFQSEHVVQKLMTINFPPSLIVVFIKQTKLGLSSLMLELLEKNRPSGADMAYLLYDSPQFLNPETFDLFKRRVRTYHEAMTILDNAKGLTGEQRQSLIELCIELANEQEIKLKESSVVEEQKSGPLSKVKHRI